MRSSHSISCPNSNGTQTAPVKRLRRSDLDACQIRKRGQQVNRAGHVGNALPSRNLPRPPNQQRRSETALVNGSLAPLHAGVPAPAIRAVVTEVQHDGVLGQAQLVQLGEHSPDIPVDVLDHGQGGAGLGHVLGLGIAVPHRQFLRLEALPVLVGHLHGRMRRVVRQVGEERSVAILLHERHSLVGEVVDYEPLSAYQFAVVIQFVVEIVSPSGLP